MVGRLEGWKVRRLEGWKAGRLEGWKARRLEEGWKVQGVLSFPLFPDNFGKSLQAES